jgi:transcriptional regulator with XRE-family HTH domain
MRYDYCVHLGVNRKVLLKSMSKTVGDFLAEKRLEKHIPIRTLANEVGVEASFLSEIETGDRPFPAKTKAGNLSELLIEKLGMSEAEASEFYRLADESLYSNGRVSPEMVQYLEAAPMAQQALRKAKDLGFTDEQWKDFMSAMEEAKGNKK